MIRPFTCVCLLLAAGAGLYTYQAKHQSELLDREIARVVKQTDAARQRTGVLRAEYALLNDPSRLAELTANHLPELHATAPTQYTNWAELDRRLPPVGPPPQSMPPVQEPAAQEPPALAEAPQVTAPTQPRTDDGVNLANGLAPKHILGGPAAGQPALAATPVSAPADVAAIGAAVAQAAWSVPVRIPAPAPARVEPAARVAAATTPRRKPAGSKTVLAAARPRKPDSADGFAATAFAPHTFLTPVSAPTETLAQYATGSGVGRSGNGGMTVSALGMARAAAPPP